MTPEESRKTIELVRASLRQRKAPVKVLLVEDNENDAVLTMAPLRRFGVAVDWAADAHEVQDYLDANDPFLVFLDLKMSPEDDGTMGLNILDFIKSFKPSTHVFILTGMNDHASPLCVEALQKGADAIWSKPLTDERVELIFSAP